MFCLNVLAVGEISYSTITKSSLSHKEVPNLGAAPLVGIELV